MLVARHGSAGRLGLSDGGAGLAGGVAAAAGAASTALESRVSSAARNVVMWKIFMSASCDRSMGDRVAARLNASVHISMSSRLLNHVQLAYSVFSSSIAAAGGPAP